MYTLFTSQNTKYYLGDARPRDPLPEGAPSSFRLPEGAREVRKAPLDGSHFGFQRGPGKRGVARWMTKQFGLLEGPRKVRKASMDGKLGAREAKKAPAIDNHFGFQKSLGK